MRMRHSTSVEVHDPRHGTGDEPDTVDRVRGVDHEAFAAWLAVFALGLAYSPRSEGARQLELEAVAGGCLEALRGAHAHLLTASVAEPPLQLAALRLLRGAIIGATLLGTDADADASREAALA
jgi:hypothetical protein